MFVYNSSEYSITKRTPFFINKKFKADVFRETQKYKELILYVVIIVKEIYKLQNELRQDLVFFNRIMKKFADSKRVWELTFKKRNKVYFLRRILNTKIIFIWTIRLSNKLDFTKLRFFKIVRALGPVIYKLDLLNSIKIARIRHILVLKLIDLEAPLIKDILNINFKS